MWQDLGDEGVLLNPATAAYYKVNKAGSIIWEILEGATDLESCKKDAEQALVTRYRIPVEVAKKDVENFLRALGLIQLIDYH